MSFDLAKFSKANASFRQRVATRPIPEKLAMLDALRERSLALRPESARLEKDPIREQPPPYRAQDNKSE